MKITDLPAQAQAILHANPFAALATVCADCTPWNSPVEVFFDNDLNLYWASWPANQHTKNIAKNGLVFVAVYDGCGWVEQGQGVFLQMRARKLTRRSEVAEALQTYKSTWQNSGKPEEFLPPYPRRIYKAQPQAVWVNIEGQTRGRYVDRRRSVY